MKTKIEHIEVEGTPQEISELIKLSKVKQVVKKKRGRPKGKKRKVNR